MATLAEIRERLLAEAVADPETGCWLYVGRVNNSGYPTISAGRRGKVVSAGRIILGIVDCPGTVVACHTCDNRRCVRPEHLYAGTQKQNVGDAVARGHMHGRNHTKRDDHPRTKLFMRDLPSILERRKRGESYEKIGSTYGASGVAVRFMVKKWEAGAYV